MFSEKYYLCIRVRRAIRTGGGKPGSVEACLPFAAGILGLSKDSNYPVFAMRFESVILCILNEK
jgi:hypothetical protein